MTGWTIGGVLLEVCVNGPRRPEEHPALPITPGQVAADVTAVAAAGADAAHLHVKDANGDDTLDPDALADLLQHLRRSAPALPVGVTTGAWAMPDPVAREAAVRSWRVLPDFASVNWHEDGADEVAAALLEQGVGVEAGLWHREAVAAWIDSPHRDYCPRVLIELPDGLDCDETTREAELLCRLVGDGVRGHPAASTPVLLHGEGSSCWPALLLAVRQGLDIRIGLEDTLELPDGSAAPGNAALVVAARLITTTQALL
jgi:uncharacterized protein (DUF849 family)